MATKKDKQEAVNEAVWNLLEEVHCAVEEGKNPFSLNYLRDSVQLLQNSWNASVPMDERYEEFDPDITDK